MRENRKLSTPFPSDKKDLHVARKPMTRCVEGTMMWNDSTHKRGRMAMGGGTRRGFPIF
jgi:hypothetical protein